MYLNKELSNGGYGHLLSQINIIGEYIKEINYKSLFNVTNEEFSKKCNESISMDFPIDNSK